MLNVWASSGTRLNTARARCGLEPRERGGVPLVREKIWTIHQLQEFTCLSLPDHSSPLDQRFDDGLYLAVGQACVSCAMQFVAQDIRAQAKRFGQVFLCPLGPRPVIAHFLAKAFQVHLRSRLPSA